jgi:hypothetical protein
MIPEVIVLFLERAIVAIGGTRDKNLVPHVHRVSGWSCSPDRRTITCLISEEFTRDLLSSLEDNGQFALTACEVPSHETYQFKGNYVGSRPSDEADATVFQKCRERFVERIMSLFGFPEEACRAFVPRPSLAMTFEVREIFVQTPGPAAGRRLIPREE